MSRPPFSNNRAWLYAFLTSIGIVFVVDAVTYALFGAPMGYALVMFPVNGLFLSGAITFGFLLKTGSKQYVVMFLLSVFTAFLWWITVIILYFYLGRLVSYLG